MVKFTQTINGKASKYVYNGSLAKFLVEVRVWGFSTVAPNKFYGVIRNGSEWANAYITLD